MPSDSTRRCAASDVAYAIIKARRGDREALGRLLNRCRNYLLLVASKNLTPALRVKVSPSDIVQESFLEAWRSFGNFKGDSEEELLGWLRNIVRNTVVDIHRQFKTGKRQLNREVPLAEVLQTEMPLDPAESPIKQVQALEGDERLEKTLLQLPEHYRQVIRMHALDELTFVQIARRLGSTAEAVRKLWKRASEELAKHLHAPANSLSSSFPSE